MSARPDPGSDRSGAGTDSPEPDRAGTGRRQLAVAVIGCAVGAGAALFAASQTWAVTEGYRPVPFGPIGIKESGTELVPAVPALALVAIAGGGGILATRGRARIVVGGLIALTGLAMLVFLRPALDHGDVDLVWPVLVAAAALLITGVGVFTLRVGPAWPAMGSRYDRARPSVAEPSSGSHQPNDEPNDAAERNARSADPSRVGDGANDSGARQETAWWDAIDRGEDPTSRG
jgi:hypothetical protein